MEYINDIFTNKLKDTVVVLGNFDGIHKGHLTLLTTAKEVAAAHGYKTVFFTFFPHPLHVFGNKEMKLLNTAMEKRFIAEQEGMDYYLEFPFTKETASMEAYDFMKIVLFEHLGVKAVVVGEDYHFGKAKGGNVEVLIAHQEEFGFKVHVLNKLEYEGRIVSSTWIREAIAASDLQLAMKLMGRPYFISGIVVEGAKLGRTIGYPTANIKPDPTKLLPKNGVYLTKVIYKDRYYYGMTNVGTKPTVDADGTEVLVETYIHDFDEMIYGEQINVKFYEYLRSEDKFNSLDELVYHIHQDELALKRYFSI